MNKKVKKGLAISLSVFVLLFAVLAILPYAFKDRIVELAKKQTNAMFNATIDFDDINLSFIRNFPNASVKLENFRIVGTGEFEKDTLLASENVDLILNLKSLFSETGYEIKKLQFNNSKVLAHVLPNGNANWNIMKEDTTSLSPDTSAMSFNLKLKDFVIENADVIYWDEEGNKLLDLRGLNHHTMGDLTADSSLLVTKTTVDTLSYWMDNIEYVSKANAELNADINANLNKNIYTFSENSSRINAIPFSFEGWFQLLEEEGYDMDLKLNAEKVDFKAILSMIPAIYANSFEGIKSGGDVDMSGFIKGKMIGDNYPPFDFKLSVVKGWFQYPDLPQSLKNINIAGHITNPGKTLDETVIDLSRFSFNMGGNPFLAQIRITYPMSDPELKMTAVGKIDLGNIREIYPLEAGTKLEGVLDMNLNLGGRMSYYDNNQYEKFTFGGKMDINNMLVIMKSLPQDISINAANMVFNNRYIDLTTLQMKIGRNDLTANGKIENFVAYALSDKTLVGTLNMQSNYFNVSDFMASDATKPLETKEGKAAAPADTSKLKVIEIPKNISFTMHAGFKQLVYEKMNFSNAKGILKIADGDMKIQDMSLQAFGGNLLMNGLYSTSDPKKPAVDFDISIVDVVFTEIVKQVEILQKIVPIFEKATGKFSTKLSFNSLLQSDMMPNLASLIGNGTFSTKSVGLTNVPAINALASGLKINELTKTTIKDLGLLFEIKDGNLTTKPFDVKIGDVKMNLGGSTGLDKTINYVGKVQLPDKFKLGQFSTVNLKIGGTFAKPKVELDYAGVMNTLVTVAKAKVTTEVNKQVDNAKEKALEEARIKKDNAIKSAEAEADKIRVEAQKLGDKLIAEAQKQGDDLVAKANNPITKKLAETSSKKIVDEAKRKAADLNAKADEEAKKLIQKAADEVEL
jgi:hypothetical protein